MGERVAWTQKAPEDTKIHSRLAAACLPNLTSLPLTSMPLVPDSSFSVPWAGQKAQVCLLPAPPSLLALRRTGLCPSHYLNEFICAEDHHGQG